eukprot:CAMPEP_0114654566 /NCGR_PEP_ID=MMETSP0191-20121206/10558_1 /TAXON_ID=126664 /ORGANISM="Sorites sp." /LENGTH=228 /DNA_ID=CAMNT_0001870081 /DNA_START=154 /DNA_END=840 /DNA_ORIENTATION=-
MTEADDGLRSKNRPRRSTLHRCPGWKRSDSIRSMQSIQRMLCLYGTHAQKEKIRAARSQSTLEAPWKAQAKQEDKHKEKTSNTGAKELNTLDMAFQVLGTLWLQEALGCRRLPLALSKRYSEGFNQRIRLLSNGYPGYLAPHETMDLLPKLCFKCSVEDKLNKTLRYLNLAHREVERQNEALAEQYALAKERRESAQSNAQMATLGLGTEQKERDLHGRESKEQKEPK